MPRRLVLSAIAVIGMLATACNNGSVTPVDPSTLPPDTSLLPPARAPELSFSEGITQLSGTNFHFFSTTATGTLYVAVPTIDPALTIGVGYGSPTPNGCDLGFLKDVTAGPDFVIREQNLPPGDYCVAIEDQHRVAPFTYTVQVWLP
jgi:hypothetical protein